MYRFYMAFSFTDYIIVVLPPASCENAMKGLSVSPLLFSFNDETPASTALVLNGHLTTSISCCILRTSPLIHPTGFLL